MLLVFLSSGLFLGWSLGANDAANVFGSAVGARMITFKRAALIASVFIIIGAVIQGAGASHTLGKLGSVNALAGAFTVALSAALTVTWMTRAGLPVSTSQAIVGAIIGWNLYSGNPTDYSSLTKIVLTWVLNPIMGAVAAMALYWLLMKFLRSFRIHLFMQDAYIRFALIIAGAFGSYSLGANNIANVMGVFISSTSVADIALGPFILSGVQQLFLIGGIAIAIGVYTYSRRTMETVGNNLMQLTPEAAIVAVVSHSLVLFVFSSTALGDLLAAVGLPRIPLVPVSSSQAIVGSIIGIGLLKGGHEIKLGILRDISLGWIATPIMAGILSFFALFFVENVFVQQVFLPHGNLGDQNTQSLPGLEKELNQITLDVTWQAAIVIGFMALLLIAGVWWLSYQRSQQGQKRDEEIRKATELEAARSRLLTLESQNATLQSRKLADELSYRKRELNTFAASLINKNEFLDDLRETIERIGEQTQDKESERKLKNIADKIRLAMTQEGNTQELSMFLEEANADFFARLHKRFPDLSDYENKLIGLLRMKLSSKEIALLLNIAPKSVEMSRYRLRKKLDLSKEQSLTEYILKI